tara:strand:+ start:570 stop:2516 length:1947 start_codon:yes stop_codon:yes gene_type:complete
MMMPILTLLSALSISGVAIFYSVIGLATIFPGAFWPVVIMGSVLEIGKLITASWVYRNWKFTPILLKTYLTIAVVVLSLITSMGIFGFLSKAHLEQNLAEDTVTQRIEIINDKIESEETYIKRQTLIIERAEKNLTVVVNNNSDAIDIEKDNIKAVEDKFKTLLAVETNTIKNLSDRLTVLDKDVSDVLTSNKSFFNEEKAAAELKASQKAERDQINKGINDAQDRINQLKEDYAIDTAVIQKRIEKLRSSDVDDKSGVEAKIEIAEANILKAQNNIDDLIIDREPLQAKMIKLEAEVGPVKYIAALAVDWGITEKVDTSEAVRWIILIIIFVFDPLAVLLLIAANQSLVKRFPVKAPKPQAIVDLEKPDEEDVTLKWNEMMGKTNAQQKMDKATEQLKDWKEKLDAFNSKIEKPEDKPVEIIQQDDAEQKVPHIDLKSTKVKNEVKDGFDPEEVEGYFEFNKNYENKDDGRLKPDLTEVIVTDVGVKDPAETTVEEALKMTETKSVETPIKKAETGRIGARPVNKKGKVVEPPKQILSNWQRAELLDNFHKQHGNFEDVTDYVQNEEQDDDTIWNKTKSETIDLKSQDVKEKFTKYKTRITTDTDYHSRIEQRIDELITKLESGEVELKDLTKEDQKVIIDILNQIN